MPARAPPDVLKVEPPAIEKRRVFSEEQLASIYIFFISLLDINAKIQILLEKLRMGNMQLTSAIIAIAAVLSDCGFHLHHCQSFA